MSDSEMGDVGDEQHLHQISYSLNVFAAKSWMTKFEMEETVRNMQDSFKIPNWKEIKESDFKNLTLKVIVHEMIPYTMFVQQGNKSHLTGFIGEMWNVLQNKLQFRSKYKQTTFSRGKEILAAGLADVMLSPVIFEAHNLDDFDIGGPVASSVYSLYYRAPDDLGSSSSYLWTWSRSLWLSYAGVLLLSTLLLFLMTNIRRWFGLHTETSKDCFNHTIEGDFALKLSLGNCFLVILGAATQQDVQIRTRVCSLRALLVVFLIFNHLMMTSYTSVLVSRLTVGNSHSYFTTIEDIPEMGSVYLGMRTNSAVYSMFQKNDSSKALLPRWRNVVNKGPCHPDPKTPEDIAANICKEQCPIFESDNIMSRLLASQARDDCVMMRLRPHKVFSQISIVFKKHSRYSRVLRNEIMKMKNVGILDVLEKNFLFEKGAFQGPQRYQEVTIGHVKALVVVYIAAASLSVILLILELVTRQYCLSLKRM